MLSVGVWEAFSDTLTNPGEKLPELGVAAATGGASGHTGQGRGCRNRRYHAAKKALRVHQIPSCRKAETEAPATSSPWWTIVSRRQTIYRLPPE